jgi:hypothetical protein
MPRPMIVSGCEIFPEAGCFLPKSGAYLTISYHFVSRDWRKALAASRGDKVGIHRGT